MIHNHPCDLSSLTSVLLCNNLSIRSSAYPLEAFMPTTLSFSDYVAAESHRGTPPPMKFDRRHGAKYEPGGNSRRGVEGSVFR